MVEIDQHMGIRCHDFAENIIDFIGGNSGFADVVLFTGIAAPAFNNGHAMSGSIKEGFADDFRILAGDFHGDLTVSLVVGVDDLGGNELENDGIASIDPSKAETVSQIHAAVEDKDIIKNGFVHLIGNVLGNEVRSSRTSSCRQSQCDGKAPDQTAEQNVHEHIIEEGFKIQDFQQEGHQEKLDSRQQDKPFGDGSVTESSHRHIQQNDQHGRRQIQPQQAADAVNEQGNTGKSTGNQVAGCHEHLQDKDLYES